EEAGDALEQRGLAAAGGPEQREELPGRDVEMHAIDRGHRPIAAGDADQAQIGRRLHWSGHRAGLHRRRAVHSRTRRVRPTAQWASSTTANVTRTSTAEIAAAAGSRSKLIIAKSRIGSVSTRGPARNSETVRLSNEEMKANAAPVATPGSRLGRITRTNVFQALAPRLRAASSRCGSRSARLAAVVRIT